MATGEVLEEASVEIAGQKVNLKSIALNSFITLLTLLGVVGIGALLWTHLEHTRDAFAQQIRLQEAQNASHIAALKEQTAVTRENAIEQRRQNCLLEIEQKERPKWAQFCKENSR